MVKIEIIPETIRCFKLTDEEYFTNPEYKDYISNSKLSLINPDEEGSEEKFESGFDSKYSASYALGSAVHAITLQPDEYIISDLKTPNGKLGIFVTEVLNFRKLGNTIEKSFKLASEKADYYSGKLSATRIKTAIKGGLAFYLKYNKEEKKGKETLYLSESIYEKWESCMNGVYNNPQIQGLLNPEGLLEDPQSYNEYAIFCEVDVTINGKTTRVKLKAKLDNFTINHESNTVTLNDLKTTGKPVNFFMGSKVKELDGEGNDRYVFYKGSFDKYHYYRQLGMYLWLLQAWVKKECGVCYSSKANLLVVETIPHFRSKVYPVNGKQIKKGLDEFKELITLVVEWKNKK